MFVLKTRQRVRGVSSEQEAEDFSKVRDMHAGNEQLLVPHAVQALRLAVDRTGVWVSSHGNWHSAMLCTSASALTLPSAPSTGQQAA